MCNEDILNLVGLGTLNLYDGFFDTKSLVKIERFTKMNEVSMYNKSNDPIPDTMIEALRCSGYGNYDALSDISDNSFDAGADNIWIKIKSASGNIEIDIADDGCGMDYDTLDTALKFGGLGNHVENDLGKFGMGLVTAGISVAKQLTVITLQDGEYNTSKMDLEAIKVQNKWCKYLECSTPEEKSELHKYIGENAISGTLIQIRNCDRLTNINTTNFADILRKHLGKIFRRFIKYGKNVYINDVPTPAIDPLEIDDENTEILEHGEIPMECINANGEKTQEYIKYRAALVSQNSNYANQVSQGIYIMRNDRQIVHRTDWFGVLRNHNDYNRLRIEVDINTLMDEQFGVEYTKRDIKLTQSTYDKFKNIFAPIMKRAFDIEAKKRENRNMSEGLDKLYSKVQKEIANKQKFLTKLKMVKEKRNTDTDIEKNDEDEKVKSTNTGRVRIPKNVQQRLDAKVKFVEWDYGNTGTIYGVKQEDDGTLTIRWNIIHPFYKRFIKDNSSLSIEVCFLIYCMAKSEVIHEGEHELLIQNIKRLVADDMNTLLS